MIPQIEPKLGCREKEAVTNYLDSGGWLTEYEQTREFEEEFTAAVDANYAWATPNGTLALMVALDALGIGDGDEVLVPNLTMVASANAVEYLGATPVLVDVDSNLCLDLEAAKSAVTDRTSALIYVSLNGRSHAPDRIRAFAADHDLYIIEDAAQSLGSVTEDEPLGTIGDVGCFSLSYAKIITTGQGGMVVTDDDELDRRIRRVRNFGRDQSGVDRHEALGLNAKFTDLQAVIGRAQLATLDDRIERKCAVYSRYRDRLSDCNPVSFIDTDLDETTPWFVDILLPDQTARDSLKSGLLEAGIGSRPFYPTVHTQDPYANRQYDRSFKTANDRSQRGLWLPSSLSLKDETIDEICDEIEAILS